MKWLALCCFLSCLFGSVHPSCLNIPEVNPKRFVSFRGTTESLRVGQSQRASHRLVSGVLHIFLREVLGYDEVTLLDPQRETYYKDELDNFHREWKNDSDRPPHYMVDLEVWLPPEQDMSTEIYNVRECGNIGPPGRYGWFISRQASLYHNLTTCMDHWRVFTNPKTAQLFSQDKQKILKQIETGEYCKADYCKNNTYTPKRCENNPCAVLLAGDYEATKFVVPHIDWLELYVEVVWVGKALRSFISTPLNFPRPLVFLDFTPSERVLPHDRRYTPVVFPPCEALNTTRCEYEVHRLAKFAWSGLAVVAKPAYESLQKMVLRRDDYQELLESYSVRLDRGEGESRAVSGAACDWMRHHMPISKEVTTWQSWIPQDGDKDVLYIGGIFPLQSDRFVARGIVAAAVMAGEAVNNSTEVLRDYKLELLLNDGQCQADIVMKTFIEYIIHDQYNKLVGILGPACSESVEPLAGVSRHFRTLVISYSAEGSSFSDRQKYPYFFRTIGENKQYKFVYLELLKKYDWKQVASLTEDGTKYTEYISHTQVLLQKNGIAFTVNRKFPQDWQLETMNAFMDDLQGKNTRIIIADVQEEAARAVMCQAYKLNMTAHTGWVWFLPPWLSPNWFNTTEHNTTKGEKLNCTTEQMLKAIDGHLSLSHSFFAPSNTTVQGNITVEEWMDKYKAKCAEYHTTISNYAGFTYDAYWTYAYALDKLLKENASYASNIHSVNATERLMELIQMTNFTGVSGNISFGDGPSRHSTVDVIQWLSDQHNHTVVATFHPNVSDTSGGKLVMKKELKWLGGKKPWDGSPPPPTCMVNSLANLLNTDCEVAVIVANIIGFGFIGGILIISFIILKYRYEKKVQLTQKYMKSLGIDLLSPSTLEGLDKWEIPRDRVVINRKLGEGAFGTVYGGEAHFTDKGWVAVAVKTLKVGSTTEEKLDFLSEAEVMKRFDHKNIVRLLGVCTKNEPVYTVMEFMLYGDLKTFLLARRHLVNEKNAEESDEISSKKLTSMALDVARALSYLAELKYVHRDVASRNCLVNASRVVKLGDFGMTRPMFENDYYKFNRKGMLPVRWMAPESLALGIFTPASDVWSYGVLLYEIITFGSFPFQGLSNNQVLEHVKAGNTITIPNGVKPQLESLIRSCWEQDYKRRPQSSELVEFIANNPRLLAACLDVPLSSVQIEDTGQLEIQLPQPRKFSLTLRNRSSSALGWGGDTSAQPLLPPQQPPIALRDCAAPPPVDYHQDSLL